MSKVPSFCNTGKLLCRRTRGALRKLDVLIIKLVNERGRAMNGGRLVGQSDCSPFIAAGDGRSSI